MSTSLVYSPDPIALNSYKVNKGYDTWIQFDTVSLDCVINDSDYMQPIYNISLAKYSTASHETIEQPVLAKVESIITSGFVYEQSGETTQFISSLPGQKLYVFGSGRFAIALPSGINLQVNDTLTWTDAWNEGQYLNDHGDYVRQTTYNNSYPLYQRVWAEESPHEYYEVHLDGYLYGGSALVANLELEGAQWLARMYSYEELLSMASDSFYETARVILFDSREQYDSILDKVDQSEFWPQDPLILYIEHGGVNLTVPTTASILQKIQELVSWSSSNFTSTVNTILWREELGNHSFNEGQSPTYFGKWHVLLVPNVTITLPIDSSYNYSNTDGWTRSGNSWIKRIQVGTQIGSLINVSKTGYEFDYFRTATSNNQITTSTLVQNDITLIPVFKSNYTITVYYNDNSGQYDTYIKQQNETIRVTRPYERVDYVIDGWQSIDGTFYTAGQDYTVNKNDTLYAIWSPEFPSENTYNIQFKSLETKLLLGEAQVEWDSEGANLCFDFIGRSGNNENNLIYWVQSLNLSGIAVDYWIAKDNNAIPEDEEDYEYIFDSNQVCWCTDEIQPDANNTIVFWAVPKQVITVNLIISEQFDLGQTSYTLYKGGKLKLPTPEAQTFYIFVCWNTKSDGTGKDYYANTTYTFDANTTLYLLSTEAPNRYYTYNDSKNSLQDITHLNYWSTSTSIFKGNYPNVYKVTCILTKNKYQFNVTRSVYLLYIPPGFNQIQVSGNQVIRWDNQDPIYLVEKDRTYYMLTIPKTGTAEQKTLTVTPSNSPGKLFLKVTR